MRLSPIASLLFLFALTSIQPASAQDNPRAILITGASSGIGLKMTEVLSAGGYHVYAGARKLEDLERLGAMTNVSSVRLDVTVQEDIDAAVDFVESQGRGLYGLINNAGVAVVGPLIEMPEEDLDFQMDVNLFGPYRVTKAFAPMIIESEGRIMNTSSISGILSGGFLGAYSMSKHGVEAYTDALGAEMSGFGVAVAAVEPGNYKSRIIASMKDRMEAAGYTPENSRYGRSMYDLFGGPVDRSQFPEPDDVALAALHFMSSDMPKRHYMVVPNQREAEITIRQAVKELVELNQDHAFSYTHGELSGMVSEAMGEKPQAMAVAASLVEAFNAHDPAAMAELVSPEFELFYVNEAGVSELALTGPDALAAEMTSYFADQPNVRSTFSAAIDGPVYVTFREQIVGGQSAIAVYEVREQRVVRVWYYPAE